MIDFTNYDYSVNLDHTNRITSVVWDLNEIRKLALDNCKNIGMSPKEVLTVAVRLSVDTPNLNRFIPIKLENETILTNDIVKSWFGPKEDPHSLTLNRFCASFANEISMYLDKHPKETWNGVLLKNVEPKYCFPHSYYISNLKMNDRKQVIAFLTEMDSRMTLALEGIWRPLALKAAFYFKKKYHDLLMVKGKVWNIRYKKDNINDKDEDI